MASAAEGASPCADSPPGRPPLRPPAPPLVRVGSRRTINHKGLRLPQAPLRAVYRWDYLWRHAVDVHRFALNLRFGARRLQGVMRIQERTIGATPPGSPEAAHAPTPQWQERAVEVCSTEEQHALLALRRHPRVLDELDLWWRLALHDAQLHGDGAASSVPSLSRAAYFRIHPLFTKTLMPAYDEAEARECAEDDWIGDAEAEAQRANASPDRLSPEGWKDSLFELACVWCTTTKLDAISDFLTSLRLHVADEHAAAFKTLARVEFAPWLTSPAPASAPAPAHASPAAAAHQATASLSAPRAFGFR